MKVLLAPGTTLIAKEVCNSLKNSKSVSLHGAGFDLEFGAAFPYRSFDYLDPLDSSLSLAQLEQIVKKRGIEFVLFTHDAWIYHYRKFKYIEKAKILKPQGSTIEIASYKSKTYLNLHGIVPTPRVIRSNLEMKEFPIFVKPDRGQGSIGAVRVDDLATMKQYLNSNGHVKEDLIACEFLSGDEFTIDCFTNERGKVIFCSTRIRTQIKSGLAIETSVIKDSKLTPWASLISDALNIVGPWFFQVKEDSKKFPRVTEVGLRVAGASGVQRLKGVNLSMLNLLQAQGLDIEIIDQSVYPSKFTDGFDLDFAYDEIYVDYDDTLVLGSRVNENLSDFLEEKHSLQLKITLITRHIGNIHESLKLLKLNHLFEDVIQVSINDRKSDHIKTEKKFLYIDDSFRERLDVANIFRNQTLVLDESFL